MNEHETQPARIEEWREGKYARWLVRKANNKTVLDAIYHHSGLELSDYPNPETSSVDFLITDSQTTITLRPGTLSFGPEGTRDDVLLKSGVNHGLYESYKIEYETACSRIGFVLREKFKDR